MVLAVPPKPDALRVPVCLKRQAEVDAGSAAPERAQDIAAVPSPSHGALPCLPGLSGTSGTRTDPAPCPAGHSRTPGAPGGAGAARGAAERAGSGAERAGSAAGPAAPAPSAAGHSPESSSGSSPVSVSSPQMTK